MSTENKTAALEIVKKHKGNEWGVDCCSQIANAVCVPLFKIHTMQPSIFIAMEDPSHITRGYKDVYLNDDGEVDDVDPQILRVETNREKENDELSMMLPRPPGIVREGAFNHQVQFRHQAYSNK